MAMADLSKHHRQSIRLKGYDYAAEGSYFITVCTKGRECLFGEIINNTTGVPEMVLNELGHVVKAEWLLTENKRHNVVLDTFIIMPNHIHGIISFVSHVGAYCNTPLPGSFQSPSKTIGAIIRGFKSATTTRINIIRNTRGFAVWQRNYYDHIIRNELKLNSIRENIMFNPSQWSFDNNNPDVKIDFDYLKKWEWLEGKKNE
jgi:putative transposase